MIDRKKPLRDSALANSPGKRDGYRLQQIKDIRIANQHLRVIDTPQKRAELYIRYLAECCMPLKGWLVDKLYDDPLFFQRYDLPSPDTILRDSRELEIMGYFEKPEQKEPQQQAPLPETT